MKSILANGAEHNLYFIQSEQAAATFYFSFVPSYAHKLKELGRGVIFFGETFIFGLIGHNKNEDLLKELTKACEEMSKNKAVKCSKKDKVKFDFKIKGQKPIETKEICQFNMTGADFKDGPIKEVLIKHGYAELD